ncbi:MAG: exodeoxyribonuclease VII small subunit [Candidatus Kapabacteria bacterium]|jgi:exodeoxyribonuclease VII small subunit|nr:exodeoxyribonuclease VII small subunit [Candidatus Kapabacteria bacterium]
MKKNSKATFEERLERLEEIVSLLDRGEAPLEELLALYEEGTVLVTACSSFLQTAEQKIMTLQNGVITDVQAQ